MALSAQRTGVSAHSPSHLREGWPRRLGAGEGFKSTAKRLAILLGESNASDAEADPDLVLEVLASSISANAGYQSLRQHKIAVSTKPQFYLLPDVGAKWLMIRISTNRTVGIKELGIYGHPGPPRTNYAFKESPAGALSVLSGLKSQVKAKLPFDSTVTSSCPSLHLLLRVLRVSVVRFDFVVILSGCRRDKNSKNSTSTSQRVTIVTCESLVDRCEGS